MKRFFCFKDGSRAKSAPESKDKRSSGSSASSGSSGLKRGSSERSERTIPDLYEENAHKLRVFSFSQLRRATSDFSRLCKIGEGGFGSVYKGSIKPSDGEEGDGIVVAVKKLRRDGVQGHKEWVTEVQCLGVVDHPNLVKLIGYCAVDGERGIQRLLVYEFMPNRTLDDHLFSKALPALPWLTRLHIVLGAAQGLAYLHGEFEVQVIYRDFKSSNVLLDHDFKPKLSDFGLAREGPKGENTHVSTAVVGTHGYAAPEYVETGHLSTRSDVWSFGVVLYEILTGRRTLESNRPKGEQKLLEWVKEFPASSKKFSRIMDTRLGNQYSLGAAINIAKLADKCLLKDKNERPEMSEIVESLKKTIQQSEMEGNNPKQSQSIPKSPLHNILRSPKPA